MIVRRDLTDTIVAVRVLRRFDVVVMRAKAVSATIRNFGQRRTAELQRPDVAGEKQEQKQ